jgi:hypothetical protein
LSEVELALEVLVDVEAEPKYDWLRPNDLCPDARRKDWCRHDRMKEVKANLQHISKLCRDGETYRAERQSRAPPPPAPDVATRFVMARDLSGTVFPVSEDTILREARKHGIGRKMGRVIIFSPDDIQHLYEVLPCPSNSSAAASRRTGSSAAPSGASALKKVLAQISDASLRKSAPTARAKFSRNRSTVVALPARSRKPR